MDLKTIALDSVPAVAELKEFQRGYNDGMRGESAATESGEGYWRVMTRAGGTTDFLGARQAGMRLLNNPDLVQIQMGDDGARLINGREDPGNQSSEIGTLAAGSETHSRRRNTEYR